MLTNQSIGYIDAPIPKGLDLKEEINRMRREKNAVILAHYYQTGDIQDIADFVGDSLALAQQAAKTTADIIVFCGVHFMGETAKVLCPDKKVLVPDLNAGCSLADSCPAVDFAEFVKQHPDHVVISYVNTTAAVKAVRFEVSNPSATTALAVKFNVRDGRTGEAILPAYISEGYIHLLPGEKRTVEAEYVSCGGAVLSAEGYNLERHTLLEL